MYETTDLCLTASLVSVGMPIQEVRNISDQKSLFVFEKTERLLQEVDNFYTAKMRIEPTTLYINIKSVKSRIYNMKRKS